MAINVELFCGGLAETNGYLLTLENQALVIDAPEGMADWVESRYSKAKFTKLGALITHGHWDHIVDAVPLKKAGYPLFIHHDSAPLLEAPEIQASFNPYHLEPCPADRILRKETSFNLGAFEMLLLLCPGHCPGSLCFYFEKQKMLFGGDVLFAGGVGRWDLPGASQKVLFQSLRQILELPDDVEVFPGHGPTTTIGQERQTNSYLAGLSSQK
jgi:hydroxyacylglutathione hydrolase